ncbi:hypothetical protein H4Q26_009579 [Puccinia striiformis f. sp. tritici PST-130]|nr:hypothetical protein H4Q26_009579 [Puccinia striiformis f. sp. tritici PST-130]
MVQFLQTGSPLTVLLIATMTLGFTVGHPMAWGRMWRSQPHSCPPPCRLFGSSRPESPSTPMGPNLGFPHVP